MSDKYDDLFVAKIIEYGDAIVSWSLEIFSMCLTCMLTYHWLTATATGSELIFKAILGIVLGVIIDGAKNLSFVFAILTTNQKSSDPEEKEPVNLELGDMKNNPIWFWIAAFAAMTVSLIASYSELGRENYVASKESDEYRAVIEQRDILQKQIDSNNKSIAFNQSEARKTKYHVRKDKYSKSNNKLRNQNQSYQNKIDALNKKAETILKDGAGEASFFNNAVRGTFEEIGLPLSYREANLVLGILIELIALIFITFYIKRNRSIMIMRLNNLYSQVESSSKIKGWHIKHNNRKKEVDTAMKISRSSYSHIDPDEIMNNLPFLNKQKMSQKVSVEELQLLAERNNNNGFFEKKMLPGKQESSQQIGQQNNGQQSTFQSTNDVDVNVESTKNVDQETQKKSVDSTKINPVNVDKKPKKKVNKSSEKLTEKTVQKLKNMLTTFGKSDPVIIYLYEEKGITNQAQIGRMIQDYLGYQVGRSYVCKVLKRRKEQLKNKGK